MSAATPEKSQSAGAFHPVGTSWRGVRDALSGLFAPALIAFLSLLALAIVRARNLLYETVKAFLMTPYAIAVHRFIILGEKTTSYRIAPAGPRAFAEKRFQNGA